jgi:hypothetical protein
MAEINYGDKMTIEKFLGMGDGYVFRFSNRSFEEFIYDAVNINIYDSKYDYASGSKANRLRAFLKIESNYRVATLLSALCEFWLSQVGLYSAMLNEGDRHLCEKCQEIAEKLKLDSIIEEIDVIQEDVNDKDISLLARSIKDSIEKNEPEVALDRLHTYCMKFIRQLCEKHELGVKKDEALNSLFGKYIKFIVASNYIDSKMTERILKYSINIIEAFNDIRNNKSLAHDNVVLNYNESLLIFNNLTNSLKFILSIEDRVDDDGAEIVENSDDWDDLPN